MENLTKENVYVKVESKEQAEMYKAVLSSLSEPVCTDFYLEDHKTGSTQESLIFKLGKFTVGNKPDSRNQVSFGQLIDIITKPEKIAVRVHNEKEFTALMNFYKSKGWKFHGGNDPLFWKGNIDQTNFPFCVQYNEDFKWNLDERKYKIIPFSDFAKEHNIKLPIITTVDGVDLFEGDNYHAAVIEGDGRWYCRFYKNIYSGHLSVTKPNRVKAFSTKQAAEKWIHEQNSESVKEKLSIREAMQNAITALMSHADGDFVSKKSAKNVGFDLHNLMITLPDSFILDDIINEVNRAELKHPNWPSDNIHAASIVAEEFGEMMREAVKIEMNEPDASVDNLRKEAIQTAATCIRLLKNL